VTTVLFVRHASAGKRKEWDLDDRLRPVDEQGRRQAECLVDALTPHRPTRILTSGFVRCRETVEPLAEALGVSVEERPELAEGASADDVRRLTAGLPDDVVVLCTHGDVVEDVLGEESEKGSVWILRLDEGAFAPVEYLPPCA
jgi:phosphohistidine phosphatase SixA